MTKVAFDPWNYTQFKPWLEKAGFSQHLLEQTFIEFRPGLAKSMSLALRESESLVLERKIRHGKQSYPQYVHGQRGRGGQGRASNRRLSKKKSSGRMY